MLKIIVQNENLSYLDKLKRILEDRQSQVIVSDGSMPVDKSSVENSETCFLCSKQYLDTVNGNSGLIQVAKSFKANSIIVIDDRSERDEGFRSTPIDWQTW